MKKIFLFFVYMFLLVNPAFSAEWVRINNDTYIDLSSIKIFIENDVPNFDCRVFWVKQYNNGQFSSFDITKEETGKDITYSLVQYIVNISEKQLALNEIIHYDEKFNVVASWHRYNKPVWTSIPPESYGEMLYYSIKNKRKLTRLYKEQQHLDVK